MCRHIYDWNIVNCDIKQPIHHNHRRNNIVDRTNNCSLNRRTRQTIRYRATASEDTYLMPYANVKCMMSASPSVYTLFGAKVCMLSKDANGNIRSYGDIHNVNRRMYTFQVLSRMFHIIYYTNNSVHLVANRKFMEIQWKHKPQLFAEDCVVVF